MVCMSVDTQENDIFSLMLVLTLTIRCVIRMLNLFENGNEIIQKVHYTTVIQCS